VSNGGTRSFHWGGAIAVGSRSEASVGDLGDQVPQKLCQFADTVYRF